MLYRRRDAHKGDFGHVFVLAGSSRFSGAAALAAAAAMRSGAGLVTIGIPKGLNNALIRVKPREVMTLPLPETREGSLSIAGYAKIGDFSRRVDVVAIGPGLGNSPSTHTLVRRVVASVGKPLVIDADGLNALAGYLGILSRIAKKWACPIVLTPHAAEMSRLLGIRIADVESNRNRLAAGFAAAHGAVTVLKGDRTVVADPRGSVYVNRTGNPGMATAGSGDVLTGIIAAFLGQGLDGFNAAKYAVFLHGLAGDLAARDKTQLGLIASDIIDTIPAAIRRCS